MGDLGATLPFCLGRHDRLARQAAAVPGVISFAGGLPDAALFPKRQLGDALGAALTSHGGSALQYGWPEGSDELRSQVASQLRSRGANLSKEEIVITNGAQQALAIALSAAPRRSSVAVDQETYPGALDVFRAAHATLTDLQQSANVYYVMPSVSNPRGRRMSDAEKRALIARADEHGSFIIEDDAYDGTWFSGESARPLVADHRDRVFHVGTFSKTLCPGLRIGWLVPPPKLARRALRSKQNQDLQANGLAQALLVEYLRKGDFAAHLRRARSRYRRKAKVLMDSVRRHLPELRFEPPRGGFSLWLESDLVLDDERLLAAAIEQGASFDLGRVFRAQPSDKLAVRLCFSAVAEAEIDEGVRRIGKALAGLWPGSRPVLGSASLGARLPSNR